MAFSGDAADGCHLEPKEAVFFQVGSCGFVICIGGFGERKRTNNLLNLK